MELHPPASPGMRRAVAKPTDREMPRSTKIPKKPAETFIPILSRPRRTFGVLQSTNMPTKKPDLKPPSTKRTSSPAKATATGNKDGSKLVHKESALPVVVKNNEQSPAEDASSTPVQLARTAEPETPYQSARSCSKCKLDRLETSSYWLAQIKQAESVQKHFVSAVFFRLALECHAEPFSRLQSELMHYVKRLGEISDASWNDLRRAYGLQNDQATFDSRNADMIENVFVDQKEHKYSMQDETAGEISLDGCFECEKIDSNKADILLVEAFKITSTSICEPEHVQTSTGGLLLKDEKPSSCGDVGRNNSYHVKTRRNSLLSSNKPAINAKSQRSAGSADKSGKPLKGIEEGFLLSNGMLGRRNEDTTKAKLTNAKVKTDGKHSRHPSEVPNSSKTGKAAFKNQMI